MNKGKRIGCRTKRRRNERGKNLNDLHGSECKTIAARYQSISSQMPTVCGRNGALDERRNRNVMSCSSYLPGERLLAEVDVPLGLAVAHCMTEVIGERAGTTDSDARGADTLHHFLVDERLDVGLAREHLYA
jgi:hypothetical protein